MSYCVKRVEVLGFGAREQQESMALQTAAIGTDLR